jgi:hypothetical protein
VATPALDKKRGVRRGLSLEDLFRDVLCCPVPEIPVGFFVVVGEFVETLIGELYFSKNGGFGFVLTTVR